MPPEAKSAVRIVATWAAGATVAGILIQVLLGAFWFGAKLEQKADQSEVYGIERRFDEHENNQARREGRIDEKLENIEKGIGRIEEALK